MTVKLMDKIKMPANRFEIRLSGSGGQGMIFASVALSEAIGGGEGKNVVQSQSYGPEARGGASKADVVISADEIFYPKAIKLDLLLAMTQEALDKYYEDLKPGGILLVDSSLVTEVPTEKYFGLPCTHLARHEVGHIMVANVVALGAISALTDIVSQESLEAAVLRRAPRGTEDRNKLALKIGHDEIMKLKQSM